MTNNYNKLIGSIITYTSIKCDGELDTITIKCLNGKNYIISTDCEDVQGASWMEVNEE